MCVFRIIVKKTFLVSEQANEEALAESNSNSTATTKNKVQVLQHIKFTPMKVKLRLNY